MSGTTLRRSVLLVARALTAAFSLQAAASAATITVTNTNDSGAGSLRDAIAQSNASVAVLDTIAFNVSRTGCSGSPLKCVIGVAFPRCRCSFRIPATAPRRGPPRTGTPPSPRR